MVIKAKYHINAMVWFLRNKFFNNNFDFKLSWNKKYLKFKDPLDAKLAVARMNERY